ncbi:hypothetical protein [Haloechinothrix halophila]|uniref:hypothetical protein n=1 Tax=Haloechinothrix halophila TaxID=1069073 RepID=UPI0006842956|nr:hypothetical protein [Haloechinothrix halophila]
MSADKNESPTGVDPRDDPRWRLVRAAARTPVPTPPGLLDRVLRSVNGLRGSLQGEPVVVQQARGRLRIGEHALALLCRHIAVRTARDIDGVHVWAVAIDPDGFEVLITVRYGVAAGDAADRLVRDVHHSLVGLVGTSLPVINVHIADVRQD